MPIHSSGESLVSVVRSSLIGIGYTAGLLRDNYKFVDVSAPNWPLQQIRLAAFAEDPPSYRNACFGVAIAPGDEELTHYAGLGIPQLLTVHPPDDRIVRWMVRAAARPERIESLSTVDFQNLLRERREEWSPPQMLRAKVSRSPPSRQLDFYDVGLMVALEDAVKLKLDQLLNEVIVISQEAYEEIHGSKPDEVKLHRLTFRLIAAKLLGDREYPGNWLAEDVAIVLKAIQHHYYRHTPNPEAILGDRRVQQVAWDRIRNGVMLQNLSVETLAYIYENTFVDKATRQLHGIHATPPDIAEYIVNVLPFEELEPERRTVLELFAGHAPFLVAAVRRLRTLLPSGVTPEERHSYFVRMLCGIERNEFSREVARDSLMLADYPNPNGWRLLSGDVFHGPSLDAQLKKASVVLANPPFGEFSAAERKDFNPELVNKDAEMVRRILAHPPAMLGLVLPRTFASGAHSSELREKLSKVYSNTNLVVLPPVFQFSDVSTVLVMAHGLNTTKPVRRSGLVTQADLNQFRVRGTLTWDDNGNRPTTSRTSELWVHPIVGKIADATKGVPTLSSVAAVHRGIEYKGQVDDYIFEVTKRGETIFPGLHKITETFEPYLITDHIKLVVDAAEMRGGAHNFPWDKPKVIANAARLSRESPWKIIAAPDRAKLVCYQNFHGIWPKDIHAMPLEVLASILNGPVANLFVGEQIASRGVQVRLLESVPVPHFGESDMQEIRELVGEYVGLREQWVQQGLSSGIEQSCAECMLRIDATVLAAYDLAPRLEKEILSQFSDWPRPGPVSFNGYYPKTFAPAIPLKLLLSKRYQRASTARTLDRLHALNDPAITEVLKEVT